MADTTDADGNKKQKYRFCDITNDEIQTLLNEKDEKSTQRSTESAIAQFSAYLEMKGLPNVDNIPQHELASILKAYYCSVKPQKSGEYSVQTLKCLQSALYRYFRKNRGFYIPNDSAFTSANEMFSSMLVNSKKTR